MGPRSARGRRLLLGVALLGGAQVSCSLLLDWTGYTRAGKGDGGPEASVDPADDASDSGAGDDAPRPVVCGNASICAPAMPSVQGWSGPFGVLTAADGPDASAPSCENAGYTASVYDGHEGLDGGAATCACSCSGATGVTCGNPSITFYSDALCNVPCGPPVALSGCVPTGPCTMSLSVTGPPAVGGNCAPDASVAVPPSRWSTFARACGLPASASHGSCLSGGPCLPATAAACIMAQGDVPCPAGGYNVHHVYYGATSDSRGCSACTCGAPVGSDCEYAPGVPTVFSYNGAGCSVPTGNPFFSPTNPSCTGKLGTIGAFEVQLPPNVVDAGSCSPSAVTPNGTLSPSSPTTFCCAP